jgi:hypothetical protein
MKKRFASIVSLVILALSMITVAYAGYPSVSNVTEKGYVLGQALGAQGNLIVDVSCSSSNFEYKVVIGYDTLSDICAEANGIGICPPVQLMGAWHQRAQQSHHSPLLPQGQKSCESHTETV